MNLDTKLKLGEVKFEVVYADNIFNLECAAQKFCGEHPSFEYVDIKPFPTIETSKWKYYALIVYKV